MSDVICLAKKKFKAFDRAKWCYCPQIIFILTLIAPLNYFRLHLMNDVICLAKKKFKALNGLITTQENY